MNGKDIWINVLLRYLLLAISSQSNGVLKNILYENHIDRT